MTKKRFLLHRIPGTLIQYGVIVQLSVHPVAHLTMNLIFSWLGQNHVYLADESRLLSNLGLGARGSDHRDAYERIMAYEVLASLNQPRISPTGPIVLSYEVFPDTWVSPCLHDRRSKLVTPWHPLSLSSWS